MNILKLVFLLLLAQAGVPPQVPTGRIDGIVLKMGSAESLGGSKVELHPERDSGLADDRRPLRAYTATTSKDGKFVLNEVPPGSYRLIATRSGYVPGEYGQRTPTSQGI